MSKVKGPFNLTWGGNTLVGVEKVDVVYDVDSDDYQTVEGQTFELDGPVKASISLDLLDTDVASLGAVLPQNLVAEGEQMSTGETVDSSVGAIDLVANCDSSTYNDLEIVSCNDPAEVYRLVNARTRLDGVEFDNKIRKVTVKFIGEPDQGVANVQFFQQGGIS